MLRMDQALTKAKVEITTLFPDFEQDLRLEEAETPLGVGRWRFTFSAALPFEEENGNALAELLRPRRKRKIVDLDADSGDLISIRAA